MASAGAPPDGFSRNDFDVFKSATEQSGFALGNAIVHREASEKHRQDEELRRASEIQRILLPDRAPDLPGFSLEGVNLPAKVVSGDYHDFLDMGEGRVGVVIADVSGKGTGPALMAATFRTVMRFCAAGRTSPAEILTEVNRQIFPDIRQDMFISAALLVLEPGSGEATLARAGHDPPLLFHAAKGELETLKPPRDRLRARRRRRLCPRRQRPPHPARRRGLPPPLHRRRHRGARLEGPRVWARPPLQRLPPQRTEWRRRHPRRHPARPRKLRRRLQAGRRHHLDRRRKVTILAPRKF